MRIEPLKLPPRAYINAARKSVQAPVVFIKNERPKAAESIRAHDRAVREQRKGIRGLVERLFGFSQIPFNYRGDGPQNNGGAC